MNPTDPNRRANLHGSLISDIPNASTVGVYDTRTGRSAWCMVAARTLRGWLRWTSGRVYW